MERWVILFLPFNKAAGLPGAGAVLLTAWLSPDPTDPALSQTAWRILAGSPGPRKSGNLTLGAKLIFRNVSSQTLASVPHGPWAVGGGDIHMCCLQTHSKWAIPSMTINMAPVWRGCGNLCPLGTEGYVQVDRESQGTGEKTVPRLGPSK